MKKNREGIVAGRDNNVILDQIRRKKEEARREREAAAHYQQITDREELDDVTGDAEGSADDFDTIFGDDDDTEAQTGSA